MKAKIEEYRALLEKKLSPNRYHHSLLVAKRSIELAKLWDSDLDRAATAGLLHDICKEMPPQDQLQYLETRGILLSTQEKDNPQVWHAVTAYYYLRDELAILDEEILCAARYHTTGRANMSLLEQIAFLADMTSEDRITPKADIVRELISVSPAKAMYTAIGFGIRKAVKQEKPLIWDAAEAYNYFYTLDQQGGNNQNDI